MKNLSKYELYPFQRKGVEFALNHHYCIIADTMGLGKTRQALCVADLQGGETLIIVPAALKQSWVEEIGRFCPGLKYNMISYASLRKTPLKRYGTIICDEHHYLKNPESKRTQTFNSLLNRIRPERLLLLSGTPIKNRVPEIFNSILFTGINPKKTSGPDIRGRFSYQSFCRHFSNEVLRSFGDTYFYAYEGHKNVPELKTLLATRMIRRKAEDVLDLPDQVDIKVPTKKIKTPTYDEVMEQFILDEKKSPEFITQKRIMSESKAGFTAKYVKEILEEVEQVIVFSDHKKTVKLISDKLREAKVLSHFVSSDVDTNAREMFISQFKAGYIKVLCITIGTGSTGLNLQHCNTIVFNDFPFVPSDLMQAKKRIHRIGQNKKCFYHYILNNEVDKTILGLLNRKIATIKKVMDD